MKKTDFIDNYRDLSVGKYEEIVRLCETEMTDLDRKVAVISVLTGKTEDEVLRLPLESPVLPKVTSLVAWSFFR